jgi:hypothetical protein
MTNQLSSRGGTGNLLIPKHEDYIPVYSLCNIYQLINKKNINSQK